MRGRGSSAPLDGEVELVRLLLGLTAAQAGQLGQRGADLRRRVIRRLWFYSSTPASCSVDIYYLLPYKGAANNAA